MDEWEQALTEAFYRFELRGRGWYGSDEFVMLEPAFEWFQPPADHPLSTTEPRDDGKRPTFLGSLVERFSQQRPQTAQAVTVEHPSNQEFPLLEAPEREDFATFDLRVPPNALSRPDTAKHFLHALRVSEGPLSFEMIGTKGEVHVQLVAGESDVPHLMESLAGYYPDVTLSPGPDRLIRSRRDDQHLFVADFGLSDEFFLPLATQASFAIDPLISLVSALALPQDDEFLCLQVLFEKVRNPWREAIREAVSGPDDKGIFENAPDMLRAVYEKTASPLFAVALRVGAQSQNVTAARRLASKVEGFISQFENVSGNHFIPLSNEHYDNQAHEIALLLRATHRAGMLLSTDELASIVHVPDASVRQPVLVREGLRTKAAPKCGATNALHIGVNTHRGTETTVRVATHERLAHMHVVGASGTGKSTFLLGYFDQELQSSLTESTPCGGNVIRYLESSVLDNFKALPLAEMNMNTRLHDKFINLEIRSQNFDV